MLAKGAPLRHVVGSFAGYCSAGRAVQLLFWQLLEQLPTETTRRQVVEHFLRTFAAAHKHGSQWRVTDWQAYVGRQHELRPEIVEVIDPESGEVLRHATGKIRRHHVPAKAGGRCGGIAAHQKRSPRRQNDYRAILADRRPGTRRVKPGAPRPSGPRALIGTRQPDYTATDATLPRAADSTWAYAHLWLTFEPTPEMLERWGARPDTRSPPRLGSAELPRLPSEPEELRNVLRVIREADVPY